MTWQEFILENFIQGRVKNISKHINKMNKKLGFKPERSNVDSTVQYWLPLMAEGRIKTTSARYLKEKHRLNITLGYNEQTKEYYKLGQFHNKRTLLLNNSRGNNREKSEDGISSFERNKNLSKEHNQMLDTIEAYAKHHNIKGYEIDKFLNVDFAEGNNEQLNIYEVKSYKNSIYTAVGQLLFYKWNIKENYKDIKKVKMHIIGNFKLQIKYKKFLKDEKITYLHIDHFKIKNSD